jgi:hypothetical protein
MLRNVDIGVKVTNDVPTPVAKPFSSSLEIEMVLNLTTRNYMDNEKHESDNH